MAAIRLIIAALLIGLACPVLVPPASASAPTLRDGAVTFARGRLAEAEAIFARQAAARPFDAHAWLWLGVTRFHRGDHQRAEHALAAAARLAPRDAVVLLWWGHALARSNNAARAAGVFRAAMAARGSDRARQLAAQALRALGPWPAPVPDAVPADPSPVPAPGVPAWVLEVGSYRRIALFYNPRLSDDEATVVARSLLGYSQLFNIDPRLVVALIVVESGFQPTARSRAGAMGLGQLMPDTARALGVDAWDPAQNVYGSIRYLRGNLDQFGWQNTHLALAAYNAGRAAVERYDGIPPYAETQWYVANVTSLYRRLLAMTGKMPELPRRLGED